MNRVVDLLRHCSCSQNCIDANRLARSPTAVAPKPELKIGFIAVLAEFADICVEGLDVAEPALAGPFVTVTVALVPDVLGLLVPLLLMAPITSKVLAAMSGVPRLFAKAWILKSSLFVTFWRSSGSAYWKLAGTVKSAGCWNRRSVYRWVTAYA